MIGEIVIYPAPKGDRERIIEDARTTVAKWAANPDLVRKHYMWKDDGTRVCGVYLWKSRAAAEAAHGPEWQEAVLKRTGERPVITYFDAFMILDNEAGTLTVYEKDGAGALGREPA